MTVEMGNSLYMVDGGILKGGKLVLAHEDESAVKGRKNPVDEDEDEDDDDEDEEEEEEEGDVVVGVDFFERE
jgi:hypothetical protein